MSSEHDFTRLPKQARSREALERVMEASTSLLSEVSFEEFTIHEVSRRADVSIGSIYARFASREDLLRALQARFLEQIQQEQVELTDDSHWKGLTFEATLRGFIHEFALLLERHAISFRFFMSLASTDPVIASTGKTSYCKLAAQVHQLLLKHRKEIRHPDPPFAVELCFRIAYSALARHLGLGTTADAAHEGDWHEMIEAVSDMCVAYLLSDRGHFATRRRAARTKAAPELPIRAQVKKKRKSRKR